MDVSGHERSRRDPPFLQPCPPPLRCIDIMALKFSHMRARSILKDEFAFVFPPHRSSKALHYVTSLSRALLTDMSAAHHRSCISCWKERKGWKIPMTTFSQPVLPRNTQCSLRYYDRIYMPSSHHAPFRYT